jgi:glycosyltransferase involved in cell wall biosynthesis
VRSRSKVLRSMSDSSQGRRPLRVLQVIDSLGPAGAEHQLATLVPHLRRHGVESEIAVLQQPYTLKPLFDGLGVTVHTMDNRDGRNFLSTTYRLSGLLRKGDYDIVHAHLWNSITAVGLSKLLSRKEKRFLTFHNSAYQQFPANSIVRRMRKIFDRLLLRCSIDQCVAVTRFIASSNQTLLGLPRVEMIFNGINIAAVPVFTRPERADIRQRLGCGEDDFLIVTAGRLAQQKGHSFLIEAVAQLSPQMPNIKAVVFGEGPARQELQNQISTRGLESKISMPGSVEQTALFRAMASADVFVFPSIREPFGLAAAEAMALGTPVIASAVDGLPELIEDGVSGKLVRAGEIAELAHAIHSLVLDPGLRLKYASAAQKRARELFDIVELSGRLAALYRRALGTEVDGASA